MSHSGTTHRFVTVASTFLALSALAPIARAAEEFPTAIGGGARVFITQCYGSLAKVDFQQLADAGFSLVIQPTDIRYPDKNQGALKAMPAYFQRAADVGLDAGIWQGGYIAAEGGSQPRVGADGQPGPYLPSDSQIFWQILGQSILDWVKVSANHRNVKMLVLDMESYLGGPGDFGESYDPGTMGEFYKSMDKQVPDSQPAPENRKEYMKAEGLLEPFIEFQKKRVLAHARELRAKIDEINPGFQIGIYAGYGPLIEAAFEGFATHVAPVIEFDAVTYSRGPWDPAYDHTKEGGYKGPAGRPDRPGLKWSSSVVAAGCRAARLRKYPSVYLAGHWPQVIGPADGSQYKFTVRQAFNSAAYGQGYWIWTEQEMPPGSAGWTSIPDWIDATMAYFKQAHAALDAGDFAWANRQTDSIADPKAAVPMSLITFSGEKASIWNSMTGERFGEQERTTSRPATAKYRGNPIRVNGCAAEWVDAKTGRPLMKFPAGPGLRALAVGDVDGTEGDELVTLGAGWVRIWDLQSGAEWLRFRVGADQTKVALEHRK